MGGGRAGHAENERADELARMRHSPANPEWETAAQRAAAHSDLARFREPSSPLRRWRPKAPGRFDVQRAQPRHCRSPLHSGWRAQAHAIGGAVHGGADCLGKTPLPSASISTLSSAF